MSTESQNNEGLVQSKSPAAVQDLKDMADLVSLCKRRGFVFPSSEVYGGINACWDYGPLGIELKRNVKERWWRAMTDRESRCSNLNAPSCLGSIRSRSWICRPSR